MLFASSAAGYRPGPFGRTSVETVAGAFAAAPEFQAAIAGKNRGQVVEDLYQNTSGRVADAGGEPYWLDLLDHDLPKGRMVLYFAIGEEHQALLAEQITSGIDVLM